MPNDRHSLTANVSHQDLIETYAPAFEAAAEAKAGAIMCKPNAFAKSDCGTGSWNLVRKSYEHCPAGILSKPPAPRNLASLNPMDLHHKCVHVREKSSG